MKNLKKEIKDVVWVASFLPIYGACNMDIYPIMGFLDHMVVMFLIFWVFSILFSIVAMQNIFLQTIYSQKDFFFLISLPTPSIFWLFDKGILKMYYGFFTVVFQTSVSFWIVQPPTLEMSKTTMHIRILEKQWSKITLQNVSKHIFLFSFLKNSNNKLS